jgi:hypothetical protein
MARADIMQAAAAHVPAMLATSTLHTWLLWGGLSLLFLVAYIGIYIWMRRPDFGEGRRRDGVTASSTSNAPVDATPETPAGSPEPDRGPGAPSVPPSPRR